MQPGWPLIGRVEELRLIDSVLRRDRSRRGNGVVLAGAAGVGKTRLAREALVEAHRRQMTCRWVTGSVSARTVPLGAFAALLPAVGTDSLRALGQASRALLAGAGPSGLLLAVDDAHLLDEMSAALVHRLATGANATVVLTVRTGEEAPDAVTGLWKDEHVDRLELVPLGLDETGALLEAVLGGPVQPGTVSRMWRLSRGNPLYLRELVLSGQSVGWLRERDGGWHWAGQLALSSSLVELVESRMRGLSSPVGEVLDLLAIAGGLDVAVLVTLVDPAALEEAEAAGLMTVDAESPGLSAAPAHPLYGEVRRARLGALRARRLRGRIAQALMETGSGADDELRSAVLLMDSDLKADAELLTRAAHRSAQLLDLPLAVRLARVAVGAGGGFAAQAVVVQALSMEGWGAEAEEEVRVLIGLASSEAERIWAISVQAGNLFFTLNRPAEAEAALRAAQADALPPPDIVAALHAVFEALLARPESAIRAASTVLASVAVPPNAVFLASWGLTLALATTGRAHGIGAGSVGYDAAVTFDTAVLRFSLAEAEIIGLRLAGYLTRAEAVAARCRRDGAEAHGVPQRMAAALTGHVALAEGRVRDAARWFREALAGFATADPGGRVFDCLLGLTQALAMAGDGTGARQAFTELMPHRHPGFRYREPEVLLAQAWVAAAEGAVSRAAELARAAAGFAADSGMPAWEVLAWQTAVRFGERQAAGRLTEIASTMDGPRAGIVVEYAVAFAAGDGVALQGVSDRFAAMGDLMTAADAAAQAAAEHIRAHRAHAARGWAGRAGRLAEACQGARTPAVLAVARPLPVTAREREVITMTASGLSNREIAQRLGVSVRTVEGHLYRACFKLGVSRRADLGGLLRVPPYPGSE